jgi:hypothetical protein
LFNMVSSNVKSFLLLDDSNLHITMYYSNLTT